MNIKLRNLGWMAAGGFLILAVACASQEPAATSQPREVAATPDIPATQAAKALAVPAGKPTPTPVPPLVSQVSLDFATGHRSISQEWDRFHGEFDTWREGLISCDASSVQVALNQFSGRFAGITETARGLPRRFVVRDLSDQLIQAAESEEEALRLLRDTWQHSLAGTTVSPDSSDSSNDRPSVFEGVDVARSGASALQKEVADRLSDLKELTSPDSLAEVNDFATAFQEVSSAWDQFHQEYDSFRGAETQRTSVETVEELGRLVDRFRDVALAVRVLPTSPATDLVSQLLTEAAEGEDLALRRLRGTFQQEKEETPEGDTDQDLEGDSSPQDSVTFVASDPSLFDAFDAQLVESNGARRQALQELAAVLKDVSEDNRAAVEDFDSQYNALLQQWNSFHSDYNEWRSTEGGCDRTNAVNALGQFTLQFADLSSSVRELPRATFLRPLGELLVEAAEREEQALRELRTNWHPFDAQVYQSLDQQRNTAGKLRRQVALGIQELLERYDISLTSSGG